MSAIVGITYLDGRPVERVDLEEMVATLAHRGPDGAGAWNEGPVGLGQRMLWTTPESLHEQLPLVHPSGNLVLTADARIDNREELISTLALEDRRPDPITDGELILHAYEKWGERCPEKLVGDFAFAIWDGGRQILFCARDPMGVKPFYLARLRIGVARGPRKGLEAHAWLECDGRIVIGDQGDLAHYTPLPSLE